MSTAAFSSDGDGAMQLHSKISIRAAQALSPDELEKVYETKRCISWIKEHHFKTVALQLPDDLLKDASSLVGILRAATEAEVVVLADTSYGSCCVDEVAAQHYSCDALIHFGPSCMSPTSRLPVIYVYCQMPIDIEDCCLKCSSLVDAEAKLVLLYDLAYHYIVDELVSALRAVFKNLVVSRLNSESCETTQTCIKKLGRVIHLPEGDTMDNHQILYIGGECHFLTNCIYTFSKCCFFSYNPQTLQARKESVNVNQLLMKRYFMVEKAKDAQIIGILVGTLGVSNYLSSINRLKTLIQQAGKKCYTFVVGKLNVAKLANFAEIECYVLVACPENSLLDSKEFYQPIITPFELEMACNPNREWTGDYVTDFNDLLPGGCDHIDLPEGQQKLSTDVSLITGRIRHLGQDDPEEREASSSLIKRGDNMMVANTAGEFLSQRSWQGLDPQFGKTSVEKAQEGSKGIAMGYTHEPKS